MQALHISIHALLAESDSRRRSKRRPMTYFYPRSPCGERPLDLSFRRVAILISIHALLAESDLLKTGVYPFSILFLSTLSLRRATVGCKKLYQLIKDFYPRSPCGERQEGFVIRDVIGQFLSTLSLRRATYPVIGLPPLDAISIHALLAESDTRRDGSTQRPLKFLSTLSLRRATTSAALTQP